MSRSTSNPSILEHLQGHIDDPDLEAVALQIFREAGKSDGIHLKDGGGGDDVADRAMDPGTFSEVVKGRRMEKDQVKGRHSLLFRRWGFSVSGNFDLESLDQLCDVGISFIHSSRGKIALVNSFFP